MEKNVDMRNIVLFPHKALIFTILSILLNPWSSNGQDFWQRCNGPISGLVSSVSSGNGDIVFAETAGGLYWSTDIGNTWTQFLPWQDYYGYTTISPSGYIFVAMGGFSSTILKYSTDNGVNWITLDIGSSGIIGSVGFGYEGDLLVPTQGGLLRSSDLGLSWQLVKSNDPYSNSGWIGMLSRAVSGFIYAASIDSIYRSEDDGMTWKPVTWIVQGNFQANKLRFLQTIPNGNIYAYFYTNMWRSSDHGESWVDVGNGLPYRICNAIAYNLKGDIFAAFADSGVYVLPNGSNYWTQVSSGLPSPTSITSLCVDSHGYLYAGVYRYGVFRSNSSTLEAGYYNQPRENGSYSLQAFPNPANPNTMIKYTIPTSCNVTLRMYDFLGRELTTLVEEHQFPGTHAVSFNGSLYSSGVYMYRLNAGSLTETRKLIILK